MSYRKVTGKFELPAAFAPLNNPALQHTTHRASLGAHACWQRLAMVSLSAPRASLLQCDPALLQETAASPT